MDTEKKSKWKKNNNYRTLTDAHDCNNKANRQYTIPEYNNRILRRSHNGNSLLSLSEKRIKSKLLLNFQKNTDNKEIIIIVIDKSINTNLDDPVLVVFRAAQTKFNRSINWMIERTAESSNASQRYLPCLPSSSSRSVYNLPLPQ